MARKNYREFVETHKKLGDSYYLSDSIRSNNSLYGNFQAFDNSQGDTVDATVIALKFYNDCIDDNQIFAYNTNKGMMHINFITKDEEEVSGEYVRTILTRNPITWYSSYHEEEDEYGDSVLVYHPTQPSVTVFNSLCKLGPSNLKFVPAYDSLYYGILLLKDGNVITDSGYYEDHKLILMNEYEMPEIPENPTWEDVLESKKLIIDILRSFNLEVDDDKEFEENVSVQNTVFFLIMAMIRPTYKGPMPIVVVDKNSERIGGSLLIKAIGNLAHGKEPSFITFNTQSEENEKMFNAKLIASELMSVIDNVTHDGDWVFPSMLSATSGGENSIVEVRILGKSETRKAKAVTQWVVDGVDVIVSADVCGRVIVIKMKARDAWQNLEFKETKDEFLRKCYDMHPKIIGAVAMMIRYWNNQGKPPAKAPNGNFSEYSDLYNFIGGVMSCCGFNHYLDNMKEVQTITNNKDVESSTVVNLIKRKFGYNTFTCQDLYKVLCSEIEDRKSNPSHDFDTEMADKILSSSEISGIKNLNTSTIGRKMAKYVDKTFFGTNYCIRKDRTGSGMVYQVYSRPNCSTDESDDSSQNPSDSLKKQSKLL